jgi:hypothetical protein
MAIKLGTTVTDSVTGFTGVATSRTEYLNGCIRVGVQPVAKDNKIEDAFHIDEQQLVQHGSLEIINGPGGDRPGPSKLPSPPRF